MLNFISKKIKMLLNNLNIGVRLNFVEYKEWMVSIEAGI